MQISQSILSTILILLSSSVSSTLAAETKAPEKPCSVHSSSSGLFYDLNGLKLLPPDHEETSKSKVANESWSARGWDYGRNFTMNFCAPVVEEVKDFVDVDKKFWGNVSAFYKDKSGDVYSIGQSNDVPIFRGRKLLLNYTEGSPCPELDKHGDPIEKRGPTSYYDNEDDENDSTSREKSSSSVSKSDKAARRRKSTLMSFICDTTESDHPSISFIGTQDHCTYFFEVRSRWACAGATPPQESGTLGPGGVFSVILCIAIAVYLIGGVVYQRNVMHQRGWRQLPNYSVWAGLFSFFQDMFTILFSSCGRCMPSLGRLFGGKRGYHRLGSDYRGNGSSGRGRSSEDANRLIDSLDEEWD